MFNATTASVRIRPSKERGGADHGWLKTFHTFSFADYYDPRFEQWGSLRVINEDRVAPGSGFPTHGHARFEIWSYVLGGELGHKDSMGNVETLKAGDLQLTYAGTGIRHSEYCESKDRPVHFLQIWSIPPNNKQSYTPIYYTRHFPRESKINALAPVLHPHTNATVSQDRDTSGPAPLQSPLSMYASVLHTGASVKHTLERSKGYVHLAMTSGYTTPADAAKIKVNGVELREGDGAFIEVKGDAKEVTIEGVNGEAEFVFFDME